MFHMFVRDSSLQSCAEACFFPQMKLSQAAITDDCNLLKRRSASAYRGEMHQKTHPVWEALASPMTMICISLSLCLSISLPAYLPACLSVCLSVRLSVCLSVCRPSVCVSFCLSLRIHIYLSIYLSIHPSIHLSIYLSIYL